MSADYVTLPETVRDLLGRSFNPTTQGWSPCPDDASFVKLSIPPIFDTLRHQRFELCDNPPCPGPRLTCVHKFKIQSGAAGNELASQLRSSIISHTLRFPAENIQISNFGESYHSTETSVVTEAPQWFKPGIVKELVDALTMATSCDLRAPMESMDQCITSWFNLSRDPTSFHALHDHGDAVWSAVLFLAADGLPKTKFPDDFGASIEVTDAGSESLSNYPGHLFFRFQTEPFTMVRISNGLPKLLIENDSRRA